MMNKLSFSNAYYFRAKENKILGWKSKWKVHAGNSVEQKRRVDMIEIFSARAANEQPSKYAFCIFMIHFGISKLQKS